MTTETLAAPSVLVDWLAEEIGSRIPGVKCVLFVEKADTVSVWTVLPGFDRESRNLIYQAEGRLIDAHPETLFDFRVVTSVDAVPHGAISA